VANWTDVASLLSETHPIDAVYATFPQTPGNVAFAPSIEGDNGFLFPATSLPLNPPPLLGTQSKKNEGADK